LRSSDGFISDAAEITADRVTVTEVWETREQWERWFNASVSHTYPPTHPNRPSPSCTTHPGQ